MNDMAVRLDPRDPTLRLRAAEDRVIREFLECGGRVTAKQRRDRLNYLGFPGGAPVWRFAAARAPACAHTAPVVRLKKRRAA